MPETSFAEYPLGQDAAVHHWLACGTVTTPLKLDPVIPASGSPFGKGNRWILNYWAWDSRSVAMKMKLYRQMPPSRWQPGEPPTPHTTGIGNKPWRYAVAEEDQVIDFSRFNLGPSLMEGWAFAYLKTDAPMTIQAELITIGPARVWVNGNLQFHFAKTFSYVAPMFIPLTLKLDADLNAVYLHGEMLAWREARLALGLILPERPPVSIALPLGDVSPEKWKRAEQQLEQLQIKQFAFPKLPGQIALDVGATEAVKVEAEVAVAVPDLPWAKLDALVLPVGKATLTVEPGQSAALPITDEVLYTMAGLPGENSLSLKIRPADGTPLEIHREIWASQQSFSQTPYGDYESRRREALEHLAAMPHDVLAAMAAVEIGRADHIPSDAIMTAAYFLENRYDCADFYAIQLLALLYRYGGHPALKSADQARVEALFKGFKFWIDEPGLDGMCYFTENHQILFQVTAYLAGQRWPDWVFTNSGWTGREQQKRARGRIESWILRRLQGSFSEWDSNAYMALDAFAMLALVEFAESERLREMATAMLHKIFFLIACQSYRGTHGSTHGRCYVAGLKSARVENTSNLQRIAWGMGILNGETRATGLLAMARRYQVPEVLQKIGADWQSTVVTRARSRAAFRPQFDMVGGYWDVSTITYRTPDVMLSAAVDHRPGAMGIQEHLWQATLGPEAVVFSTYPGNSQEHGNARPNFWSGSARLPRVGMFDRTVICLYRFEERVGLGFSHAYFPIALFDEYRIEGAWAFARVGQGYVALWGDGDLVLTPSGRHTGQELRGQGPGNVWLCHVGRTAEDGDFAAFCAKVRHHAPQPKGIGVRWATPANEQITFGWEGPMLVDGTPQDWSDFPHYENAYTNTRLGDEKMIIQHAGQEIILDLKHGRVVG